MDNFINFFSLVWELVWHLMNPHKKSAWPCLGSIHKLRHASRGWGVHTFSVTEGAQWAILIGFMPKLSLA